MINERKIMNPEYASSSERLSILRSLVIDGEDAEAVLKYVRIFKKGCEDAILENAKVGNERKYNEVAGEYKIVCKFCVRAGC